MLNWKFKTITQMAPQQVYQMLQLRSQVFVIEQNCLYLDADGQDLGNTIHILGEKNSMLAAYARIIQLNKTAFSIGRVCVPESYRQFGYGKQLITKALAYLDTKQAKHITISAQTYLLHFYQGFGFIEQGEPYLEDGIKHIKMVRKSGGSGQN